MWTKVKTEPGSCPCFYDLFLIFYNCLIFIKSDNNLSLWSLSKSFHRNDGSLCFSTHISSVFIPLNEIMPITVTRMPYIDWETKCLLVSTYFSEQTSSLAPTQRAGSTCASLGTAGREGRGSPGEAGKQAFYH